MPLSTKKPAATSVLSASKSNLLNFKRFSSQFLKHRNFLAVIFFTLFARGFTTVEKFHVFLPTFSFTCAGCYHSRSGYPCSFCKIQSGIFLYRVFVPQKNVSFISLVKTTAWFTYPQIGFTCHPIMEHSFFRLETKCSVHACRCDAFVQSRAIELSTSHFPIDIPSVEGLLFAVWFQRLPNQIIIIIFLGTPLRICLYYFLC